uniref:NADH-ubiquinone oxidoreductase chain 6 n=1 Tax=Histeroidea sp. 4 KM-2017 TaxID=2219437 RepID=A0A346RHU1_9COLE|nr:NADH dehydrogenase subunit 6 [Histeroidea sp. 4 KM-2017]
MITVILLITNSIMFITMQHPLSMGLTLMIQTIIVALLAGMVNMNFWFSYIICLIMIGGMLILFIYMTSVASNEKFKLSLKSIQIGMTIFATSTILMILMDTLNLNFIMNKSNMNYMQMNLNKFINFPMNMILIMVILYLFMALVATVKISLINAGPLRPKF